MPQWAIAEEVVEKDEDSDTGTSPVKAMAAPPRPKSLTPSLKKPTSLQRLAAISIVTHADQKSLYGLVIYL